MSKLILHCGASAATRSQVASVVTPEPTATHFPLAHGQLLDRLGNLITDRGLSIVDEAHALTRGGDRYFGLFTLGGGDDYGMVIGVRNSHDKSFSAGLTLGTSVFVCDNLSFNGDVVLSRKHTRWGYRDLPRLMATAFGKLTTLQSDAAVRFDRYKAAPMSDMRANDFMIRALDAKAICASKIPAVLKEWRTPSHPEFEGRTAWSMFNAFTEVYKTGSLNDNHSRSMRLHGLMANYSAAV